MIGLLLAMYPARWRQRYGEEFRAVLESRPLGPFDFADVLIGALDARLSRTRFAGTVTHDGGPLLMLRIGGVGAIAGGTFWFLGLAAASAVQNDPLWVALLALGTLGLLVALVGLSAFQAHRDARLAWAAFAIPAIGAVVSFVGLVRMVMSGNSDPIVIGSLSAWSVWMIGLVTMLMGSILFAIATIRAAVFSRRAAQALGVSSTVVILAALGLIGTTTATTAGAVVMALVVGSFAGSWVALGVMALRRGPIRAIVPA